MMNTRVEMNEEMMAQVNGGGIFRRTKVDKTKSIMDKKAAMDKRNEPYNLTTPDGRNYYSDGQHHSVSIEV